ncbi:6,7-dimethyl-8-ribityllumazine synthase [Flaviaesturariibacter flavus]|uniref:6,7-dimethyl-8-ribityllumazine synthase n=1 Tax=Flaviaesturariibacter flavus TaxID=2502780 RepID=A0A4R1BN87_9BACT|nr:6,7-dimethyl-8-ribityllumazine synthase [Flaviaesturariibacter flavus]TCJ18974.1 6,7-dimethyl-8-ribityllumazine synthase [Flaviaesturariibacter flavus]
MADSKDSTLWNLNEGIPELQDALVVLVKTEWNAAIADALEEGVLRVLSRNGLRSETILVPGAVEIPFAIRHYWDNVRKKDRPAAFIALGCVLRGDTPHFEYVCQSVTMGITQLNLSISAPSIFGVLTVNTQEQADERIGGRHGHKGEEAAITAIKMIQLSRRLKKKEE